MMKRSVKTRLTAVTVVTAVIFGLAFSALAAYFINLSAVSAVTSMVDKSAVSAAQTLSGKIEALTAVSDDLSDNDAVFNRAVDEVRLRMLRERNQSYSADGITFDIAYADNLISIDGSTLYKHNDAVVSAAGGKAMLSAPYEKDGKTVVCYAAPLTKPFYDRDCVLICTSGCDFFDDVFGTVSLGKSCGVYVTDDSGTIITGQSCECPDMYVSSAAVEQRPGWTLYVEADPAELMPDLTGEILAIALLTAGAAVVFCIIISAALGRTLKPIKRVTERLSGLAEGDFSSPVPEVRTRDEAYEIAQALERTTAALRGCTEEIARSVKGAGDASYPGDFSVIHDALAELKGDLRKSANRVKEVSQSVITAAEELQNAEIAPAREFPEYAPIELPDRTGDILNCAQKAEERLGDAGRALTKEKEKISALAENIAAINECADRINDVIAQIEDVAFQTNILALNAAVEASAAGEYGRSFAVVADEVRELAGKSREAAKSTSELIEQTLGTVSEGTALARETADSLEEIYLDTEKAVRYIDGIKSAAKESRQAAQARTPAPVPSPTVDTEKAQAVAEEARRLRGIADGLFR